MGLSTVLLKLSRNPVAVAVTLCLIATFANCFQKDNANDVSLRDPKRMFLPFIKVVIPPEPCGSAGTNEVRDGVCLPRGKCETLKGDAMGDCSMGFGQCCRLSLNCTMDENRLTVNEYVSVLKTPTPSTAQCTIKIRRKKDVCQIRLDFKEFTSEGANSDGICHRDALIISNSITVPDGFTTCGNLRDQHMYLSFGGSDTIDLTPRFVSANSRYEIVVSQIPCLSRRVVPSHCLQYFNKTTDTVRSFDFGGQQQSNQQYVICVEGGEQSRQITWRQCVAGDFGTAAGVGQPFFITGPGIALGVPCPGDTDWIQINGNQKYCGNSFPLVTSTWKPYTMNVNFDLREVPPFPFGTAPGAITNSADCLGLGPASGGIFDCFWTDAAGAPHGGSCQCDISPALGPVNPAILFGGTPDSNNTGFCLKYQV